MSFRVESTGCVMKCWLFSQAIKYVDLKCSLIMCRVVILCDDNGIGTASIAIQKISFCKK